MEAHHSGVPIIVLSADRPEALRGVGSNQTTDQPGIFGTAVQHSWDVGAPTGAEGEAEAAHQLARAVFAKASGPVHLNLSFAEPLSSPFAYDPPELSTEPVSVVDLPPAAPPQQGFELEQSPGTIVVAGTGAGARAEEVARELGAPLIAEVASGAHFGPHLVVAYRELLATANFGDRVSRVIVFGHPTLSREVPALIQRDGVQTIVVRGRSADDYNPGRRVSHFADSVTVVGEPSDQSWVGRWVSASRALIAPVESAPDVAADSAAFARAELAAVRAPVTRRSLVEAVWRATWPHDRLVLGASRLIREADKFVAGKKISAHANRGLAGIDGTISTALGIALASQATDNPSTTRVLLGDLTFLHDVGALLFGVGEEVPNIQVIVGNDDGGTIFDGLEVGRQGGSAFDRVLLTSQHAPVEQLARAYGWEYVRVDARGALDQALTASGGRTVIEVPLPRE
jgi:2-succinyl-5-enolpyruvyl-6-hydroxy-3-cyclohexene-1-carboxylate synthase